jgi:hypothetical protein
MTVEIEATSTVDGAMAENSGEAVMTKVGGMDGAFKLVDNEL